MAFELTCVNTLATGLEYFHNGMKYSSQWSQNIILNFKEGLRGVVIFLEGMFSPRSPQASANVQ